MTSKNRRTIRIIVDIPVEGELTINDARWLVERSLSNGNFTQRLMASGFVTWIGNVSVKSLNRVIASTGNDT